MVHWQRQLTVIWKHLSGWANSTAGKQLSLCVC